MSLNIREIFDTIITDLGQDNYVSEDAFELDITKCLRLVKPVLGIWNKYSPHDVTEYMTVEGMNVSFPADNPPKFVSRVVPTVNNVVTVGSMFGGLMKAPGVGSTSFIWRYQSPTIYCQYDGEVQVTSVFNHVITSGTETSVASFSDPIAGQVINLCGMRYTAHATTETTTAGELATAFAAGVANASVGTGAMTIVTPAIVSAWTKEEINVGEVTFASTTPNSSVTSLTVTGTGSASVHLVTTTGFDHIITTLNWEDSDFIELIKARIMKSLGRNRRAFTLSDIPIMSDADSLVMEGTTLEDQIMTSIRENSKSYLAW